MSVEIQKCAWCTHDETIHGEKGCTPECQCEGFAPPLDKSVENIERLSQIHLNRYESRIQAALRGEPGYRASELHGLLQLWKEVRRKGYHFELLSEEAKAEVSDALWDGLGGS